MENTTEKRHHSPVAYAVISKQKEAIIQYANPLFYQYLSYSEDELMVKVGNRLSGILPVNEYVKIHEFLEGNEQAIQMELPFIASTHENIWLATIVMKSEQDPSLAFLYFYDLQEYKKNAFYLKDTLAIVHQIMKHQELGILLFDTTSRVILFRDMKSFSMFEMEGIGIFPDVLVEHHIIQSESLEVLRRAIKSVQDASFESHKVCEIKLLNKQKEYVWVRLALSKHTYQGDSRVLVVFSNIHAEKTSIAKYSEQSLFYQSLLSSQDAYGEVDVDEDRVIMAGGLWNAYNEFKDTMPYSKLTPMFIKKVVHIDDQARYLEMMDIKNLKRSYQQGIKKLEVKFRRIVSQNKMIWMSGHIHLFENPLNQHVIGFMYRKILHEEIQPHDEFNHGLQNIQSAYQEINQLIGEQGDMAYLINPDTYTLLSANQAFYDRLGIREEEGQGQPCYKLLHKRDTPCFHCQKANWNKEKYFTYRFFNEILDQEFLIKNKLVTWNDETAMLAIAVDLSNDKNSAGLNRTKASENNCILHGLRNMQTETSLDGVIKNALETIAYFYRADAVRLWTGTRHNETANCKWYYVNELATSEIVPYEENEYTLIGKWLHNREWFQEIRFHNQEQMMFESYEIYELMNKKHIENQHWSLLCKEDQEFGILEIDNIHANFENTTFLKGFLPFVINEWSKSILMDGVLYTLEHDTLTRLYNRTSYDQFVRSYEPDQCDNIAVITIDINGLSEINTMKGSHVGDSYLKDLAECITYIFPNAKNYRLGGDEFLIIWTNVDIIVLEHKIEELRQAIRKRNEFVISIGFAWDSVEKKLQSLINYALESLQIDKKNQSNHIQQVKVLDHYKQQSDLLTQIEKGNYLIYLQPKVDIRTDGVVGAEALIRYYDEKRGIVPPMEYIPHLEKSGLIRYIDLYVLDEVCKLLDKWHKEKKPCPIISLNFSRVTMMEQNLIEIMTSIVDRYTIDKKYIEIEITESFADAGKAILYQNAKRVHEAGYAVALDDFGTNFTNLSILSDIHVDVLKIDKSLICSMTSHEKNITVLKYIMDMCNELDVKVIAEGVETMEQRSLLKDLGCRYIQGYLYSKPIDVTSFEELYLPKVEEQS